MWVILVSILITNVPLEYMGVKLGYKKINKLITSYKDNRKNRSLLEPEKEIDSSQNTVNNFKAIDKLSKQDRKEVQAVIDQLKQDCDTITNYVDNMDNPGTLLKEIYNVRTQSIISDISDVSNILNYYPERIIWLDYFQDLLINYVNLLKEISRIAIDNPTKSLEELLPLYNKAVGDLSDLSKQLDKESLRLIKTDTDQTEAKLNAYHHRIKDLKKRELAK